MINFKEIQDIIIIYFSNLNRWCKNTAEFSDGGLRHAWAPPTLFSHLT